MKNVWIYIEITENWALFWNSSEDTSICSQFNLTPKKRNQHINEILFVFCPFLHVVGKTLMCFKYPTKCTQFCVFCTSMKGFTDTMVWSGSVARPQQREEHKAQWIWVSWTSGMCGMRLYCLCGWQQSTTWHRASVFCTHRHMTVREQQRS